MTMKPSPETLVDRLRGIYPSAVSPHKPSPINAEAADEIERLRAQLEQFEFKDGDRVEKHTGDYTLAGVVVACFCTLKGHVRYVVEHQPLAPGLLHIYGPNNLRKI